MRTRTITTAAKCICTLICHSWGLSWGCTNYNCKPTCKTPACILRLQIFHQG